MLWERVYRDPVEEGLPSAVELREHAIELNHTTLYAYIKFSYKNNSIIFKTTK